MREAEAGAAEECRRVLELIRRRGLLIDELNDLLAMRISREVAAALVMVLPTTDTDAARGTIVRALTDPAARGIAAKPLIRELARAKAEGNFLLAWTIGNALCVVADDSVSGELLQAIADRDLGYARQTLAEALGRVRKRPEIVEGLVALLREGEITGHAIRALGKLGAWEARGTVEPFLTHKMAWVRTEAKKALLRMDKAQARGAAGTSGEKG